MLFLASIAASNESRTNGTTRVKCFVWSHPYIANPLCGSNRNERVLSALQHRQALYKDVSEMDHVFKHRFRKKILDMMRAKSRVFSKPLKLIIFARISNLNFQEIDTENVCQILRGSFCCCDVYREWTSCMWVIPYTLPHQELLLPTKASFCMLF